MRRQRLFFAVGTRPEAVKLAPLVRACRAQASDFEVVVCLTGQHRELLTPLVEYFDLRPACDLQVMSPNQNLAELASRCLRKVDDALSQYEPDFVIVQGDTATAATSAQAAFYHRLRVVHVEAGLRTGNLAAPFPEEFNRRLVSIVATMHCAPTKQAAANLRAEHVPADQIRVTGNTVVDALLWTVEKERQTRHTVLSELSLGTSSPIVLVTAHRRESFGPGLAAVCDAVRELAERYDEHQFIWPVHVNPQVREPVERLLGDLPNVRLIPPLDYPQFVQMMDLATLILTDSGGVQEEAPSLGKPVLVLRDVTERPEGVAAGCAELVGTDAAGIVERAVFHLEAALRGEKRPHITNPYGDGGASRRIVEWLREKAE